MEKVLDKILNSTHDAMIAIDQQGLITLYNKAAERLTGKSAVDVLGQPVVDIVDNTRLMIVMQTGEAELNQRQQLANIEIITNRLPIKDEDTIIGAVAIFRDVSEMVMLAEELTNLKEIQMTMQAVFNATQDAISVVDRAGIHIMINPAYTKIMGYTEREIIGCDYSADLIEGDSVHKRVLESGKPVYNAVFKSRKHRRNMLTSAAPIIVDNQVVGSVAVIHDMTEITQLTKELAQAKQIIRNLEAKYTFDDIKGESLKLKDAIEKARIAAITPATVILRGESGTGKELFAHAIHNASNRRNAQFIRVNCAAISESILESELFGYVEGAFTGASKGGRMGLFERASGGTIFLDEIGEVSQHTQLKLLRVIQEKEIVRVGGSKPISVDVRIISATHVDLEKAVKAGQFREDLYYRLNVIPIVIPPLRERMSDLEDLVKTIIMKYNQEYGRNVQAASPMALNSLMRYDWPGNIRELENYIGRAMIQMKISDTHIAPEHLPRIKSEMRRHKPIKQAALSEQPAIDKLADYIADAETRYIAKVLSQHHGNRTKTAKTLGISIRSLYYKLEKYHLMNS